MSDAIAKTGRDTILEIRIAQLSSKELIDIHLTSHGNWQLATELREGLKPKVSVQIQNVCFGRFPGDGHPRLRGFRG